MNRTITFALLACVVPASPALGEARFMKRDELVRTADIIAVIHVATTEPAGRRVGHRLYRQRAVCLAESVIKGQLPKEFDIHARKNFICAKANYEPDARYLVFLKAVDGTYVTINHHRGQYLVTGEEDTVEWFSSPRSPFRTSQSLAGVTEEIEGLLSLRAQVIDIHRTHRRAATKATRTSMDPRFIVTFKVVEDNPILEYNEGETLQYAIHSVARLFHFSRWRVVGKEFVIRERGRIATGSDLHPISVTLAPPVENAVLPDQKDSSLLDHNDDGAQQPLSISAKYFANFRPARSWELTIDASGDAVLHIPPAAIEFQVPQESMTALRKAVEEARLDELNDLYGSPNQRTHPPHHTVRIEYEGSVKDVTFIPKPNTLSDIPPRLLELWCLLRETFDDYPGVPGVEHIRAHLDSLPD